MKEKVYEVIKKWSNENFSGFDGHWKGYSALMDETGLSLKDCKKCIKELVSEKLILRSATVNSDGMLNGTGYFTTEMFKKSDIEQ